MKINVLLRMFLVMILLSTAASLQAAAITTLSTTDDAEIDQHANWASDTRGIPHLNWGHNATELRVKVYGDDYYTTGLRQDVMLKWDVSGISSEPISNVSLNMAGWDGSDGPINVYGIIAAPNSWAETNVTWNSWANTTYSLVLLGQMYSSGPWAQVGDSAFSSSALTSFVASWVDGTVANNGLILKLDVANPSAGTLGDSFSAKEELGYGHAPQLMITQVPEPTTITLLACGLLGLIKRK
ncbi:MAG: DNRLRE domain-containing protein [Phycisphaerales bacterium]